PRPTLTGRGDDTADFGKILWRPATPSSILDKLPTAHPTPAVRPTGSGTLRMTSRHALAAALLAALVSFLPLAAAQPDAGPQLPPPPAGHSYHGEVFDEGPRQKAYLMGGTGN